LCIIQNCLNFKTEPMIKCKAKQFGALYNINPILLNILQVHYIIYKKIQKNFVVFEIFKITSHYHYKPQSILAHPWYHYRRSWHQFLLKHQKFLYISTNTTSVRRRGWRKNICKRLCKNFSIIRKLKGSCKVFNLTEMA